MKLIALLFLTTLAGVLVSAQNTTDAPAETTAAETTAAAATTAAATTAAPTTTAAAATTTKFSLLKKFLGKISKFPGFP